MKKTISRPLLLLKFTEHEPQMWWPNECILHSTAGIAELQTCCDYCDRLAGCTNWKLA